MYIIRQWRLAAAAAVATAVMMTTYRQWRDTGCRRGINLGIIIIYITLYRLRPWVGRIELIRRNNNNNNNNKRPVAFDDTNAHTSHTHTHCTCPFPTAISVAGRLIIIIIIISYDAYNNYIIVLQIWLVLYCKLR